MIPHLESSKDPFFEGLMFRGEKQEFPTMRTSLDRWLDALCSPPNRIWDSEECRSTLHHWQILLLRDVASRGFDSLGQPTDIQMPEVHAGSLHILTYMSQNPAPRRMLCRLQHQQGPTNLLDWTRDMHIALHFACQGSDSQKGRFWFMSIPFRLWRQLDVIQVMFQLHTHTTASSHRIRRQFTANDTS